MRRDLITITIVMLLSSGIAATVNAVGHKMDWIRRPLASLPTTQADPNQAGQTSQGSASQAAAESGVGEVQAAAVLEHLNNGTAFFVDARESDAYAEGHLRGAVNVPSSAIYSNLDKVTSVVGLDQLIIIYCGGGGCEASHNVADALRRDVGFTNVMIYAKGWEEVEASEQLRQCTTTGEPQ